MNKAMYVLILVMAAGLLLVGCEKDKPSKPKKPAVTAKTPTAEPAMAEVKLCAHCGQIKGSELCCKEGAEKCADCGLAKGSPACCKGIDFPGGDVALCAKCGQVKGAEACCKADAEKCPKCGMAKGSPGCCKIAAAQ